MQDPIYTYVSSRPPTPTQSHAFLSTCMLAVTEAETHADECAGFMDCSCFVCKIAKLANLYFQVLVDLQAV